MVLIAAALLTDMIESAMSFKMIGAARGGTENVDIDAAKENGPRYSTLWAVIATPSRCSFHTYA